MFSCRDSTPSDDAPMFSRWGVPLHWDSTLNATELQTKARDFATTYHLRQTHALRERCQLHHKRSWRSAWPPQQHPVMRTGPERLADVVQRLSKASAGYEAFGDIAIVLSGSTDKLASTLESLYERVVQPSESIGFRGVERRSGATRSHKKSLTKAALVGAGGVRAEGQRSSAARPRGALPLSGAAEEGARAARQFTVHVGRAFDANLLREGMKRRPGRHSRSSRASGRTWSSTATTTWSDI